MPHTPLPREPLRALQDYDYLHKVLLVGDSAVGKSSIARRFAEDEFDDSFIATIGVDLKVQTFEVGGKVVKLQLWDTAGQERFRSITNTYFRGADCIILVYDVTDAATFDAATAQWMTAIRTHASERASIFLVGNKMDLLHGSEDAAVRAAARDAQAMMQDFVDSEPRIIGHLRTSAKTGEGIDEAFAGIAEHCNATAARRRLRAAGDRLPVRIGSGADVDRPGWSIFTYCSIL